MLIIIRQYLERQVWCFNNIYSNFPLLVNHALSLSIMGWVVICVNLRSQKIIPLYPTVEHGLCIDVM